MIDIKYYFDGLGNLVDEGQFAYRHSRISNKANPDLPSLNILVTRPKEIKELFRATENTAIGTEGKSLPSWAKIIINDLADAADVGNAGDVRDERRFNCGYTSTSSKASYNLLSLDKLVSGGKEK